MDQVRDTIFREIAAILVENNQSVKQLNENQNVFDTGLDSLGFAILVARLEEVLGIDPFAELSEAIYPQTLGEFISIYTKKNSH